MAISFIFLTEEDITTHVQFVFIEESIEDDEEAIERAEIENISLIRSKLSGRYNMEEAFDQTGEHRHPLLVRCLVKLVIYDVIRRNAPRKIPADVKEDYKDAIKWLDNVNAGIERPNLPPAVDEEGNPVPVIISGNARNDDYYI